MNAGIFLTLVATMLFAAPTPAPKPSAPKPTASSPAVPKPAPSVSGPQKTGAGFSFSDWHVSTDQLDANWQSGSFNTPGHITLTRPGSDISADKANGNWKNHQALLTGHVVLHDTNGVLTNFAGQSSSHVPATLTCDNLNINGTTKTYVATGNVHFIQGPSEVRSNRAVMNGITHEIHLFGSVQLTQ